MDRHSLPERSETIATVTGDESESPDADPHVRWCGRRGFNPPAYPIILGHLGGMTSLCASLLWAAKLAAQQFNLVPHGTPFHMVIYHSHSLHKRVSGRRAEELPSTYFQIFTNRLGSVRDAGSGMFAVVLSSVGLCGVRLPLPDIGGKASKLIDELNGATSIVYGSLDFSSVTDNAIILEKPRHLPLIKTSDLVEGKTCERSPKVFTLAKNGQPGESGLEALQANLLEEPKIVSDRATPFFVVVSLVVRVVTSPPTARNAIARCAEVLVIGITHRVQRVAGLRHVRCGG